MDARALASGRHEARVINFGISWNAQLKGRTLHLWQQVFQEVSKIHKATHVTVICLDILRIPDGDFLFIVFSHTKEIALKMNESKPIVLVPRAQSKWTKGSAFVDYVSALCWLGSLSLIFLSNVMFFH